MCSAHLESFLILPESAKSFQSFHMQGPYHCDLRFVLSHPASLDGMKSSASFKTETSALLVICRQPFHFCKNSQVTHTQSSAVGPCFIFVDTMRKLIFQASLGRVKDSCNSCTCDFSPSEAWGDVDCFAALCVGLSMILSSENRLRQYILTSALHMKLISSPCSGYSGEGYRPAHNLARECITWSAVASPNAVGRQVDGLACQKRKTILLQADEAGNTGLGQYSRQQRLFAF